MSRHNPNNAACDLVLYNGADEVRCTCDEDDLEIPEPSVVLPPNLQVVRAEPAPNPAAITLTGQRAILHRELEAASREYVALKAQIAPAEQRWRAAVEAYSMEIAKP